LCSAEVRLALWAMPINRDSDQTVAAIQRARAQLYQTEAILREHKADDVADNVRNYADQLLQLVDPGNPIALAAIKAATTTKIPRSKPAAKPPVPSPGIQHLPAVPAEAETGE
jgi:hypothetical protein